MPQSKRNRVIIACFGLILLVLSGSARFGAGSAAGRHVHAESLGSGTVPTATPTPIPTDTPTAIPTATPAPTDTPTATATSRPSPTPEIVDPPAVSVVIISEFLADNENSLRDEDGDRPDWIELFNPGELPVDLDGWTLTDRADNLKRWLFPEVVIPAGGYLVVFASDKDRAQQGRELHTNFKLRREGEYLAIARPDGSIASSYAPEYPTQYPDITYGLDGAGVGRYFSQATPGGSNDIAENRGPRVTDLGHTPAQPLEDDSIVVTALVAPGGAQVDTVLLTYRIMFGAEVTVPMEPAGASQDGHAIYRKEIPASAHRAGDMVRYYVVAIGVDGSVTRWPAFPSPLDSPEYLGTMVFDSTITSRLSILHWFSEDVTAAETADGTRATVYYAGQLYDNIKVRPRGNVTKNLDKKSFKFVFNDGYHLTLPSSHVVDELNLNATTNDPSYVRQILAWETFRDAGSPYSIALPIHVRRNGEFYALLTFIEQPEQSYFDRQGMDWKGALYKNNGNDLSTDTTNFEKKTRTDEDDSDLLAVIANVDLPYRQLERYLFDNINIPAVLNYMAVNVIIEDWDHVYKNHYLYRDTRGTGEWMFIAWDKDLTFWSDGSDLNSHPLHGSEAFPAVYVEDDIELWNHLTDALLRTPRVKEMYLRRLRTLMDQLLQSSDTPVDQRYFETRIDELVVHMGDDVARDVDRWSQPISSTDAIASLIDDHIDARRSYLYGVHAAAGGLIPSAQGSSPQVRFEEVVSPANDELPESAYFKLHNDAGEAVDISGWTISGDVEFTFQAGVIIPSNANLYVAKDVMAFRNREVSPTGGEGRFVQGGFDGILAAEFGSLLLRDNNGVLVDRTSYRGPDSANSNVVYLPIISGP